MKVSLTKQDALIVVDLQNDFCSGGALAVEGSEKIIPVLNKYISIFKRKGLMVIATRDWHPPDHCSFKDFGGKWPKHCVRGTAGAEFHKKLKLPKDVVIISKATKKDKEAYSGFSGTNLKKILWGRGVSRVFIGGLATDYCVKATIFDALSYGFTTFFLIDASRGVAKKTTERSIADMLSKGCIIVNINDISLKRFKSGC